VKTWLTNGTGAVQRSRESTDGSVTTNHHIINLTELATNTQQTWRQEFLGSRSSTVERSSTRTVAARTFLLFFQTIFDNTSLWRLKHLVTLSTYRRYINKCIYLSIYNYKCFNFCYGSKGQYTERSEKVTKMLRKDRCLPVSKFVSAG